MPANSQERNRKILIYAGVAGAVLALVVLLKKRSSSSTSETTRSTGEQAGAVYTTSPAAVSSEGSGEGLAARQELNEFEQKITSELPGVIQSGIKTGLESNRMQNAGIPGELISSLATFASAITGNRTGEQTGGGAQSSPSSNAPTTTPSVSPSAPATPAPAPSSSIPPPKAPTPSKPGCPSSYPNANGSECYRDGTCPNGCPGHFYQNGHSECAVKQNGKCVWT